MLAQEVGEAGNQFIMTACRQDHPAPMRDCGVLVCHKPVERFYRELLEAANACGGREIRKGSPQADIGDGWGA
ncbi:hypothetical protein MesoLjLa_65320 (plasmid) [Mesorhizobium sp. L-2-11]|nr:hypothetical protein MesoLjLa_65320 [Mesorhizobium sp. L-2-11]